MSRRRYDKTPVVRTAPRYPARPPVVGSGRGVHHGGEAGPMFRPETIEGGSVEERIEAFRAALRGFGLDMERG